ncbi:Sodium/hydrogen exchanger family-domain-containing protein [Thamnocephalis sphaerospora]|uniref:Sodium/hydrogen exchanger family-domain-containing protein n=1 Tax=Thamnocephalis sphaerospora TaxID=78915 RepID=A0A4P9XW31_9FUNG|nr:Sodium/hydrogen exchanger family-domain-containing protein [Thamnocephalis sphaerospora]|eukprot:RKP10506.1 Sodium/hydrogen exchanger family-domain-containing protein [Thamnocephalis sphaerospora]
MIAIQTDAVSVVSAVLGLFIVLFGLASMPIKEWLYLSEALVAMLFGIAIGPIAINLVDPTGWGDMDVVALQFSRIVIAISASCLIEVMAAGISLPKAYLVREWRSIAALLFPVMFFMWIASAGIMYWLLPIGFVLSNSIIKGRFAEQRVPDHVRNLLSTESGSNDGLGLPYLLLPVLFLSNSSYATAVGEWFYAVWAYQILLSIVIGAVVGYVARKLLYFAESRELIDKESFLVFSFALAMFLMGAVFIIGSDDLFAVFVAGNAFTWDDWFRSETQEAHLQEVVDMFFNLSYFVYFGTIIPWSTFGSVAENMPVWKLVVLAVLILVLRRVPAVLVLQWMIPVVKTWREAIFVGWFGPMGVGAVFYAMVAKEQLHKIGYHGPAVEMLFPVVSFLVLSSVIAHGITVPIFQLSTSQLTRTLTNPAAIAHLVQRLPLIRPDQEIVIRHTRNTTTVTVSRPSSVAYSDYPEAEGSNDDSSSLGAEDAERRSIGNKSSRSTAPSRQPSRVSRQPSHLSQRTRTSLSHRSVVEERIVYVHTLDEQGRRRPTLVEDSILGDGDDDEQSTRISVIIADDDSVDGGDLPTKAMSMVERPSGPGTADREEGGGGRSSRDGKP